MTKCPMCKFRVIAKNAMDEIEKLEEINSPLYDDAVRVLFQQAEEMFHLFVHEFDKDCVDFSEPSAYSATDAVQARIAELETQLLTAYTDALVLGIRAIEAPAIFEIEGRNNDKEDCIQILRFLKLRWETNAGRLEKKT